MFCLHGSDCKAHLSCEAQYLYLSAAFSLIMKGLPQHRSGLFYHCFPHSLASFCKFCTAGEAFPDPNVAFALPMALSSSNRGLHEVSSLEV